MSNTAGAISAPVSVAVISVENLDTSLAFYSQTLGLTVTDSWVWQGSEFERHWQVPAGTTARCAFLAHGPDPVGRIQLMEFDAPNRKIARSQEIRRATGLFNLNLYTRDIAKDYAQLKAQGSEIRGANRRITILGRPWEKPWKSLSMARTVS